MGRPIKKGSTDQSTVIRILDSTTFLPETAVEHDSPGIDLWYRREQEVKSSITEAALGSLDAAHADGGIEYIGDGYYRLDLPDAAVAAGAGENSVQIGGAVTGMVVIGNEHALVDYDPYDAASLGVTVLADWVNDGRLDVLLDAIPTTAMRGTDGANTTTPPTVTEIQTEMEENGASHLDTIVDELANATDGLSALKALIDAIPTTAMRGTDNAALASGVDVTHIMGVILTEGGAGRLAAAFIKLFDVATPLLVASDVMRGTDGANTTVPDAAGVAPTASEIQTEMEENGASILDTISDLLPASIIAAATDIPAMVGTDNAALASVCTEARLAELAAANMPADIDAIKAKTDNQPSGIPKNVALDNFEFVMIDSTDHISPKAGLTVTVTISKDGSAFAASTNSVSEISGGTYKISFTQAEQNAKIISWRMTAPGADQRDITVITST